MTPQIAALFVMADGPYAGLPNVEIWDERKDARLYRGPHSVVAHPPCERWGRYWHGGPSAKVRRIKGDDGGCFQAALAAVRKFGGVLEHPAASSAWETFGLNRPPRCGGWVNADFDGGWTCCVDQGHYGHRTQKATWLYVFGVPLPILKWDKSSAKVRLDDGYHSKEERRRATRTGVCQRLSRRQRLETPPEFRDLLLAIARGGSDDTPVDSAQLSSGKGSRRKVIDGSNWSGEAMSDELSPEVMEVIAIQCPRCSSTNTKPYAGRQYCLQCGETWRRNGEPDER